MDERPIEGYTAEDIGGEPLLSVVLLEGLLPIDVRVGESRRGLPIRCRSHPDESPGSLEAREMTLLGGSTWRA